MPTYKFTIGAYRTKINPAIKILTGQKFGRFLVIGFAGIVNKTTMWHCICDCGNGRTVASKNLTHGRHISCGCYRNDRIRDVCVTHGESLFGERTPEWRAFKAAKNRCENPKSKGFHNYGGRGIRFLLTDVRDLLQDIGRRPSGKHSLDRIDNNGHYEMGNIRWGLRPQQNRNQRRTKMLTAFGKTQCQADWAAGLRINPSSLGERLASGWCVDCAVSVPARHRKCPHR